LHPIQKQNVKSSGDQTNGIQIEVFFDQDCPLCRREIDFIRKRDKHQRIQFTNIHDLDHADPSIQKTYSELMAEIHGRLPDGTWIIGVEVFRRLYGAIGWTTIVAITRWPLVREILDWMYRIFAKRRLVLTGRCNSGCEVKV